MSDIAVIQKATLYEMADAIIDTTERTESFKVSDMPRLIREDVYNKGYADGVDEGKKTQYDEFWDGVQDSGNRINYPSAFARWVTPYIRPKYKVTPNQAGTHAADQMFRNNTALLAVESAYFDFSQMPYNTYNISMNQLCYGCSALITFEDIGIQTPANYTSAWQGCTKLQTIEVLRCKASTTFSSAFDYCYELVNLTIEGTIGQNGLNLQWSTKLSRASIESVINALSTTTSGLSITLSKVAVNNAFKVGDVVGSESPDWVTLVGAHSNWTINLI